MATLRRLTFAQPIARSNRPWAAGRCLRVRRRMRVTPTLRRLRGVDLELPKLLAEHPQVEFKGPRISESDLEQMRVRRIQQYVPLSANRCRRNKQSGCLSITNPIIAESAQRLLSRCMPTGRKNLQIESANFNPIQDLALDENQICWSKIRLQIYEDLDGSERQRS